MPAAPLMKNEKGLPAGRQAIVLLSGGLDSATSLYLAKKKGFKCFCLIFDYGQRHRREIESAKRIASVANCPWQIIKINLPWKGSALLDRKMAVPKSVKVSKCQSVKGIPNTYVPARNIIFLSFALSYAEAIKAQSIFIGAHSQDYSVAVNSRVIKRGDGIIPIQGCERGDYILSTDRTTLGIRWSKVGDLIRHRYINQSMYKITTEHGRSINVSDGHSLFSLNRRGEMQPIKVKDLKRGHYILAPSKLKIFGNIKEINLLDLLSNEKFIFVIHPKLGNLMQEYKNEQERWWRRSNIMPLDIYNKFYRKKAIIKDEGIFIKSRKDRVRSIPAILELNETFCFFLGLWLADGSFGGGSTICISCNNTEAIKNLKIICKFFKAKMSVWKNKIDKSLSSPLLMKIMKRLGFNGTAHTKIIPSIIYDLPLKLQSAFLRGFIIGDGSVRKDGPIDISSVNESLIDGLQDLLLNFSIVAYKKKQLFKKTNFTNGHFILYRLAIENSIDKQLFLKNIGNIDNKISPLTSCRCKIRGIPVYQTLNDDLKSLKTIKKFTKIKNKIRNNAIYTNNRFDRDLLLKLINQAPQESLKKKWDSLVNNELIFAQIRQKRKISYVHDYIYDLSVEKNENFICDGLLAHNSGYPDCRPEFYRAFSKVITTGTKSGVEKHKVRIETPLIRKTKAQIIRLAVRLGVPLESTWSCYQGGRVPCGRCDSCYYRMKGFKEAGIQDPAAGDTLPIGKKGVPRLAKRVSL